MDKVAIVILNWNGEKFLRQFLPSVLKHSSPHSIYVADNHSIDDSIQVLREEFPSVKIIQLDSNYGFCKGYNLALQQIRAEYYILVNSDIEVTANWISPIIELMDSDQLISACQPKIKDYYQKDKFEYAGAGGGFIDSFAYPFCRGRIFNTLETDKGQYDDTIEVFWASGACMFVRAKDFQDAGGFDEDFFAHMEEIDLCWRLKNKGKKIYYCGQSTVYHVGGGTLSKYSPQKTYLNFRNNLSMFIKNENSSFLKLFLIFFLRLTLDGLAAIKFMFTDSPSHLLAVLRAHYSVYGSFLKSVKKRKSLLREKASPNKKGIYKGLILLKYYLLGQKYYITKKGVKI